MRFRRHVFGLIILASLLTMLGRAFYLASLESDRADARVSRLQHYAETGNTREVPEADAPVR